MPFVSTIGFGGIVGFLLGFALKRIMTCRSCPSSVQILAVIAGVFFAPLLYLESQHIVNINWDKLQTTVCLGYMKMSVTSQWKIHNTESW